MTDKVPVASAVEPGRVRPAGTGLHFSEWKGPPRRALVWYSTRRWLSDLV